MKRTDYAYAVARIRANEKKLLSGPDYDALIASPSLSACFDVLRSKGLIDSSEKNVSVNGFLKNRSEELWTLLTESVPDKSVLKVFCVQNDFFNLKAALKCMLSGKSSSAFFKSPTSLDLDTLEKAVEGRNFESLGEAQKAAFQKALDVAVKTENGQEADIVIDRAAMEMMKESRSLSGDELTSDVMNFLVACADMKIAVRSAQTGKSKSFAERSLCECDGLDIERLSECAENGADEVFEYLLKTDFAEGALVLRDNRAVFEKWIDDEVIEKIKAAKYIFFGFEPILAYYFARITEVKMLRFILLGKQAGISEQNMRERMRQLYV